MLRLPFLVLVLALPNSVLFAVTCEDALRDALTSYAEGRLEEVPEVRASCLEARASRQQKVAAWALLARVYTVLEQPEAAAEAARALVRLDPDYRPAVDDPMGFVRLLEELTESQVTLQVGTVSKTDEPLREAPATVVVVTAEQIERRGYLDLEELLHDLPGIDLSRGNGEVYSNVYLRGYRSARTDRLLFLIDGVEQNDLHSNTAYISRQIPISNVERVEVVYGPMSTVYGPNAFTGVISVTTTAPQALVEDDRSFAVRAQLGGGPYGTQVVDATLAGRGGGLAWSLTGRLWRSDERDLSGLAEWDGDPALPALDGYRELLRLTGPAAAARAGAARATCDSEDEPLCTVRDTEAGVVIEATDAGAAEARRRDATFFAQLDEAGVDRRFDDATDDWAIDGKLQAGNLTLGVQSWRRSEGTSPWYGDLWRAGAGNRWTPRESALWIRWKQPLGPTVVLNLLSRYKAHELDGDSRVARRVTFAGGGLDLVNLADTVSVKLPFFQELEFDQSSSQLRNELTVLYEPSSTFNVLAGVELRRSAVQLELEATTVRQIPEDQVSFFADQLSGADVESTDLGVFFQASYRPRDDLKLVAGGRFDDNSVRGDRVFTLLDLSTPLPVPIERQVEGTGSTFNPRLAVVHTRGDLVFKAVYAEAFKNPSNFQRFSREPGVRDVSSLDLSPERVRHLELHASWQPRAGLAFELVGYQAAYSDAVGLLGQVGRSPIPTDVFKNVGRLRIEGLQASARFTGERFELLGHYTYTDPRSIDPTDALGAAAPELDELRIGDIASHRLNLELHLPLWRERLQLNGRANWVGERPTGAGTTAFRNPLDKIDSYLVAHATLAYEGLLPGATWQLVVRNLFDTDYQHPGVGGAGGQLVPALPQPGREVFLRLVLRR